MGERPWEQKAHGVLGLPPQGDLFSPSRKKCREIPPVGYFADQGSWFRTITQFVIVMLLLLCCIVIFSFVFCCPSNFCKNDVEEMISDICNLEKRETLDGKYLAFPTFLLTEMWPLAVSIWDALPPDVERGM